MAEEPQFIVRLANGRKSKPSSRTDIQQLHAAGKIPLPADVLSPGTRMLVSVDDFVSDSKLLSSLLADLPEAPATSGVMPLAVLPSVTFKVAQPSPDGFSESIPTVASNRTSKRRRSFPAALWAVPLFGSVVFVALLFVVDLPSWLGTRNVNPAAGAVAQPDANRAP